MKNLNQLPIRLALAAAVSLVASSAAAGVIDDALNLPGMENVKSDVAAGKFEIKFKSLGETTDKNGKKHTVLAEKDGDTLNLSSDVYGEGTNAGVIAQHILHEYIHWKHDHQGNSKENELPCRKAEAQFWRDYKAANPGVTDRDCDHNESTVFTNGAMRSDAEIQKAWDFYGDDPDGKQKSDCVYNVGCAGSQCILTLESSTVSLDLFGTEHLFQATASTAVIQLQSPDEANNVQRFDLIAFQGQAPSAAVAVFGDTGPNLVQLAGPSFGYIDLATNNVSIYLDSQLTNSIYGPENPIQVRTHVQGVFDPNAPGGPKIILDTLAFDDIPLPPAAAIPALSPWGTVIATVLLLMGGLLILVLMRWRAAAEA